MESQCHTIHTIKLNINCIRILSSQKSTEITPGLSAEAVKVMKEENIPQVIKVNNCQLKF